MNYVFLQYLEILCCYLSANTFLVSLYFLFLKFPLGICWAFSLCHTYPSTLSDIYISLQISEEPSLVAQLVKNLPAMQKTWVWSVVWEDPLEKGKATHSSILAQRIPWFSKPNSWLIPLQILPCSLFFLQVYLICLLSLFNFLVFKISYFVQTHKRCRKYCNQCLEAQHQVSELNALYLLFPFI